ncbi:MvaI/BcnI family restriction endonuclease [Luteimonas sp. gir]|uniref:MvaI/BcnI family restriction endonuclease n=1 Tax=Luteimonas sp. gir TaxID=3127960 RepID=UPI003075C28A
MTIDATDRWLSELELSTVFEMLRDNGVTEAVYKVLPRNANSKNQVYLGTDLSQLGKLPSGEVTAHLSVSEKSGKQEAVFRAPLEFYWLNAEGLPQLAPNAQLIFYPQYPEVRFSGFLRGCRTAPSSLWVKEKRGQEPDRILVLGIGDDRKIIALTLPPESPAAREIRATEPHDPYGALYVLRMPGEAHIDGFRDLMRELCRIHRLLWVPSTRLDPSGALVPCSGSNCNGNTLESLLGIRSNGYSLPDFRGWEVKARQVTNVDSPGASTVTLFTPEPTGGVYMADGLATFLKRYGYPDTKGREDRLNFGGLHRSGRAPHSRTGLRLVVSGYVSPKKFAPDGSVQLIDAHDHVAASWSFAKLMDHWKVKHAAAAFVPVQKKNEPEQQYRFGRQVLLGEGAEFGLLLDAMYSGKVYYDPGIKLEGVNTDSPKPKKRSQFRVASRNLPSLYESSRLVDVCDQASR